MQIHLPSPTKLIDKYCIAPFQYCKIETNKIYLHRSFKDKDKFYNKIYFFPGPFNVIWEKSSITQGSKCEKSVPHWKGKRMINSKPMRQCKIYQLSKLSKFFLLFISSK